MTILLDMDEVLCDFLGGAARAHGLTKQKLLTYRQDGQWYAHKWLGMTVEEWWWPIHGEAFWRSLDQLPWMTELIHIVADRVGESWYIVTTPSRDPFSCSGKVQWIQDRFGASFTRYIFTAHKHLLARPDAILIDDRPRTVERFRAAGGQAILFPAEVNDLRGTAHDPLAVVLPNLEKMLALNKETRDGVQVS